MGTSWRKNIEDVTNLLNITHNELNCELGSDVKESVFLNKRFNKIK